MDRHDVGYNILQQSQNNDKENTWKKSRNARISFWGLRIKLGIMWVDFFPTKNNMVNLENSGCCLSKQLVELSCLLAIYWVGGFHFHVRRNNHEPGDKSLWNTKLTVSIIPHCYCAAIRLPHRHTNISCWLYDICLMCGYCIITSSTISSHCWCFPHVWIRLQLRSLQPIPVFAIKVSFALGSNPIWGTSQPWPNAQKALGSDPYPPVVSHQPWKITIFGKHI